MSEAEKKFDEHIRQEFRNYSPDVSPHIWERIVAEREKRKPAGFWITLFTDRTKTLIAGLILAAIISTGLFLLHSSVSPNDVKVNENKFSSVINTNKTNTQKSSSILINKSNNKTSVINQTEILKNSLDKKKIIQPEISTAKKTNNVAITSTAQPVSNLKHVISHSNKIYSSSVINKPSVADINSKDILANNENKNTSINNQRTPSYNNNTQYSNDKQDKAINKYLQSYSLQDVDKLSFKAVSGELSSKQKNIPAVNLPECPTVEKNAAANKKYFEVYIGPDYDIRTLTDTTNSVYLEKRKESSEFTSGFSAGVRYTKVFNNGMSIRGALNYSQINEKFSFVQGSVIQTTYIIDPNTGDTTGSYTVRGTRYKTTYNHYRSIDIPLTIGYELGNGKFHANINAGIIANIYSWQKGDVLDTNYQPVDITTGKGSSLYQFKTNIGLGATGGISLYYKITDQLHILGEPYVRYNFQPMSNDNLSLRQKYTTIGLRLGLRFDLP